MTGPIVLHIIILIAAVFNINTLNLVNHTKFCTPAICSTCTYNVSLIHTNHTYICIYAMYFHSWPNTYDMYNTDLCLDGSLLFDLQCEDGVAPR